MLNGKMIHWEIIPLSDRTTIDKAEMNGFDAALNWIDSDILAGILSVLYFEGIKFVSDSETSIKMIFNDKTMHDIINYKMYTNIHFIINKWRNIDFEIQWIEAHIGWPGNEEADDYGGESGDEVEEIESQNSIQYSDKEIFPENEGEEKTMEKEIMDMFLDEMAGVDKQNVTKPANLNLPEDFEEKTTKQIYVKELEIQQ